VHTEEEMQLFHGLTETKGKSDTKVFVPFDSARPNFDKFAIVWNGEYCLPNRNVYYKTPQHLKEYYNVIEDRKKHGNAVIQNLAISEYVRAEVEDESRLQIIIPVAPEPPTPDISRQAASSDAASPSVDSILPPHNRRIVHQAYRKPSITSFDAFALPLPPVSFQPLAPASNNPNKRRRGCTVCNEDGCSDSSKPEY
jgi:hypothetical protein